MTERFQGRLSGRKFLPLSEGLLGRGEIKRGDIILQTKKQTDETSMTKIFDTQENDYFSGRIRTQAIG